MAQRTQNDTIWALSNSTTATHGPWDEELNDEQNEKN